MESLVEVGHSRRKKSQKKSIFSKNWYYSANELGALQIPSNSNQLIQSTSNPPKKPGFRKKNRVAPLGPRYADFSVERSTYLKKSLKNGKKKKKNFKKILRVNEYKLSTMADTNPPVLNVSQLEHGMGIRFVS